jgi:hypothetical protein
MFDIGDSLRVWTWAAVIIICLLCVGAWAVGKFL